MGKYDFTKLMDRTVSESVERMEYALEQAWKNLSMMEKEYRNGTPSSAYKWRKEDMFRLFTYWQKEPMYKIEGCEDWENWSHAECMAYIERNIRKIPGQDDLIFSSMYTAFEKCPVQEDYMERLVARLGDTAFTDAPTLRLRILKQFVKYADWKVEELFADAAGWYGIDPALTGEARKEMLLEKLDDTVFELLEVKLTAAELAQAILETIDDGLLQQAAEEEIPYTAWDPAWSVKEKLEYIFRLQAEEDSEEDLLLLQYAETIEASVRKQLWGKSVTKEEKKKGTNLSQRKKDYKERKQKPLTLLRTAESLSKAIFLRKRPTKEMLYRFAIVFGMTVSEGEGDPAFDEKRDLEKNIFADYYSDSLLKYFSEEYEKTKSNLEEPEGTGIDFKNWYEICFVYALMQEELSADEKMKLADRLIQTIQRIPQKKKKAGADALEQMTRYYRDSFFLEQIGSCAEEELVEYIRMHYYVPKSKIGGLSAVSRQNTAKKQFDAIADSLCTWCGSLEKLEGYDYGNLCSQPQIKELLKRIEENGSKEEAEKKKQFEKIIENMSEKMLRLDAKSCHYREEEARLKLLVKEGKITKAQKKALLDELKDHEDGLPGVQVIRRYCSLWREKGPVTRTKLLAAMFYRYYHTGTLVPDGSDKRDIRRFDEMLEYFREKADPVLVACRYQKISSKNLFDMMLVLFALYYT